MNATTSRPTRAAAAKTNAPQNKADGADENKARTVTGDDVVVEGHPDPSTRAGAGSVEGSFTCLRELQGDRAYASGDAREGKVSELAHLARSGAVAPADKATKAALADFAGIDVDVVKPKSSAAAEEEG